MLIEVYTRENCKYCFKTKHELETRKISYTEYNLAEEDVRDELLIKAPKATLLPQIFINEVNIGGYDELLDYFDNHNMNIKT
mgnify:CR=1 FL=1|tara:strand:- start:1160 stop:1405 length:246 start_codon:yes stop_codon:yes gene_type:complete